MQMCLDLTTEACLIADPAFVHAQLIPDSAEKNDDKLYFFFREKSADAPQSPAVYSRIGRICLVCTCSLHCPLLEEVGVGYSPYQPILLPHFHSAPARQRQTSCMILGHPVVSLSA